MSQWQKLLKRLQTYPKDFTWDELVVVLRGLGYEQQKPGRSGGSRRRFYHPQLPVITLHQPHPHPVLKRYQVDQIVDMLKQEGIQ